MTTASCNHGTAVLPRDLETALEHVRNGGRLYVATYTRVYMMTAKTLAGFEKAGSYMLKEEGDGYRMRNGKGSIYLFPGQLKYAD